MDSGKYQYQYSETCSGILPEITLKVSDFYVENGSYLRLKNLTIGYSLPKEIYSKININRLRIYMTANNLFTITKYKGFDPEVGMNTYGVETQGDIRRLVHLFSV